MMPGRHRVIDWTLTILFAALAVVVRLLPDTYAALYNFAVVGALGLFAAARLGLLTGLLVSGGAMLLSGLLLWWQHDFHPHYEPFPSTFLGLAAYSLIGWGLLRKSSNVFMIVGSAQLASLMFFLITNAFSWVSPLHNYERSLAGLGECYAMALPFYRTTIVSDLVFTGVLFGLSYALSLVAVKTPVPIEVRS